MNYKESKQILKKIREAKKILVNCHRQPDPDAVGSALSLYQVIKKLNKEVRAVSPNDIPENLNFLPFVEVIEKIDLRNFDYSSFDLFLVLDSSSWYMVTGDPGVLQPEIPLAVIDHHKTNERFGELNIVDAQASSTTEILYLIFKDWGITPDKNVATTLLAGLISDSGAFRFPSTTPRTISIASSLIEKGADKNEIIFRLYFSTDFKLMKFWEEVLSTLELDEESKFAWSAIPYKKYLELGKPDSARESSASTFFQSVEGTDFGIVMVEEDRNKLMMSLRSRTGLDVSEIARVLGGGGHQYAAGATIYDLQFKVAVQKVLETARKFTKKK